MMPSEPCVCEAIAEEDGDLVFMDGHVHDHSDFEPFACAEPDCPCEGHHPPGVEPEPAENDAQAAPDARYRAALTIPAQALDFSAERVTAAATHLDDIIRHHTTTGNPHDPHGVLGLADLLEQTWPDGIDPLDVLALAIRRLHDATTTRPTRRLPRWVTRR